MINYALDAGASVIIPQVDTVEQAEHVVSATKFGKKHKGSRSVPPARFLPLSSDVKMDEAQTVWENQNSQAAVILQMESEKGINNLDAILSSVGKFVDAVWLGTLDLRASMGYEGGWGEEPDFLSIIRTFEDVLDKHQVPAAGQCLDINMGARSRMVFTVAASDWAALIGTRDLIFEARKQMLAVDKRQAQLVSNGSK